MHQTKPLSVAGCCCQQRRLEKTKLLLLTSPFALAFRTSLTLEWILIERLAIISEWGLDGAMVAGAPKGGDGGGGVDHIGGHL